MSLEGISSKGSLRFDEFPTSMKAAQSFSGSRATRLLAYENARPSESRRQPLKRRLARKDSAVRVSLSSNHNVKEPVGVRPIAPLPNPQWKQIPHLESTTAVASPETKLRSAPLLSEDRAVAYSPAGSGNDPREEFI